MKPKIILCLALVSVIPFSGSIASEPPTTNVSSQKMVHNWEYIAFPQTAPDGKILPIFTVGYADKTQGLRLDIQTGGRKFFKNECHFSATVLSGRRNR